MYAIEPYFAWRDLYIASEDARSPFYGRAYSEFEFTSFVYNYAIHPQWDPFGSNTLYLKILYADYERGFCVIELIGEWNDCLYNDIMYLKREVVDPLIEEGITKFILIGENVLNFHYSDDSYYQEWFEEVEDGWIAFVNFRDHVLTEFGQAMIDYYVAMGGQFNTVPWRTMQPLRLLKVVEGLMMKRLGA